MTVFAVIAGGIFVSLGLTLVLFIIFLPKGILGGALESWAKRGAQNVSSKGTA